MPDSGSRSYTLHYSVFSHKLDHSVENEVFSDILAQAVQGGVHQEGKKNSWNGQEGGLKQTSVEGTSTLLSSSG